MAFLIGGANSAADTGFDVDNSARFDDNAYMSQTWGSSGNRRTWTLSMWIKYSGLNNCRIFSIGDDASNTILDFFFTSGDLRVQDTQSGSETLEFRTDQVFKDPSAWSHLVFACDTTQGTEGNRFKIYHNGTQITSFSTETYPSENLDTLMNHTTGAATIGARAVTQSGTEFDGYMAEVVVLDGTAAAPTEFGEFDEDSPTIWKPKDVSGLTFGTNGFYLDFEDSSNLGNDANGGSDFSETNFAATDQSTDTPTNNFSTMNPLANKVTSITFSEGNLKIDFANGRGGSTSTFGLTTGKWYVEYNITTMPADERFHFGIVPREIQDADDIINTNNQGTAISGYNAAIYADSGSGSAILNNFYGNNTTRFDSFTGIIGMALDITNGTITFSKAGAWVTGSNTTDTDFSNALKVDISTPLARHDVWHIACGTGNSTGTSGVFSMNFGNPAFSISSGNADANGYGNFEYAVPSGYFALCTKNLAEYG